MLLLPSVHRFGSRSPETGRIVQTAYSAGPRGFRARGPDIARQPADLSQVRLPYSPPVPVDSAAYDPAYDRYHDPNEDPSYKFTVRTASQSKSETADSRGHVEGVYSYLDDVGKFAPNIDAAATSKAGLGVIGLLFVRRVWRTNEKKIVCWYSDDRFLLALVTSFSTNIRFDDENLLVI